MPRATEYCPSPQPTDVRAETPARQHSRYLYATRYEDGDNKPSLNRESLPDAAKTFRSRHRTETTTTSAGFPRWSTRLHPQKTPAARRVQRATSTEVGDETLDEQSTGTVAVLIGKVFSFFFFFALFLAFMPEVRSSVRRFRDNIDGPHNLTDMAEKLLPTYPEVAYEPTDRIRIINESVRFASDIFTPKPDPFSVSFLGDSNSAVLHHLNALVRSLKIVWPLEGPSSDMTARQLHTAVIPQLEVCSEETEGLFPAFDRLDIGLGYILQHLDGDAESAFSDYLDSLYAEPTPNLCSHESESNTGAANTSWASFFRDTLGNISSHLAGKPRPSPTGHALLRQVHWNKLSDLVSRLRGNCTELEAQTVAAAKEVRRVSHLLSVARNEKLGTWVGDRLYAASVSVASEQPTSAIAWSSAAAVANVRADGFARRLSFALRLTDRSKYVSDMTNNILADGDTAGGPSPTTTASPAEQRPILSSVEEADAHLHLAYVHLYTLLRHLDTLSALLRPMPHLAETVMDLPTLPETCRPRHTGISAIIRHRVEVSRLRDQWKAFVKLIRAPDHKLFEHLAFADTEPVDIALVDLVARKKQDAKRTRTIREVGQEIGNYIDSHPAVLGSVALWIWGVVFVVVR